MPAFSSILFAFVSYWSVKGIGGDLAFPVFVMVCLLVSHHYHQKRVKQENVKMI